MYSHWRISAASDRVTGGVSFISLLCVFFVGKDMDVLGFWWQGVGLLCPIPHLSNHHRNIINKRDCFLLVSHMLVQVAFKSSTFL